MVHIWWNRKGHLYHHGFFEEKHVSLPLYQFLCLCPTLSWTEWLCSRTNIPSINGRWPSGCSYWPRRVATIVSHRQYRYTHKPLTGKCYSDTPLVFHGHPMNEQSWVLWKKNCLWFYESSAVSESTQFLNNTTESQVNSIPWASTIWGLRRTAKLEEFDLGITTIDLGSKNDITEVDLLLSEILGDSIEEDVAFRDGNRFTNRVVRSNISTEQPTRQCNESDWFSLYLSSIPGTRKVCLRQKSFSKPSPLRGRIRTALLLDAFWINSWCIQTKCLCAHRWKGHSPIRRNCK